MIPKLLIAGTVLLSITLPTSARATDLWGIRASTWGAFSGRAAASSGTLGATYETFVDGWGLRGGADLGYLYYTWGGRSAQWTLAPEVAWYPGADDATWRPYLLAQIMLSPTSQVFEGLRIGPEAEWRDICRSNLRLAFGGYYQALRYDDGVDWLSLGLRVTVTWGMPTRSCLAPTELSDLPGLQ